jgi:hypothetical protein
MPQKEKLFMEWVFELLRWLHIGAGFTALRLFWIPIV